MQHRMTQFMRANDGLADPVQIAVKYNMPGDVVSQGLYILAIQYRYSFVVRNEKRVAGVMCFDQAADDISRIQLRSPVYKISENNTNVTKNPIFT